MGSSMFRAPRRRMNRDVYLLDVAQLEAERALKHAQVHGRLPEHVSADARRLLEQVPDSAFSFRLHH